jgi:uncharacterized membrane protein
MPSYHSTKIVHIDLELEHLVLHKGERWDNGVHPSLVRISVANLLLKEKAYNRRDNQFNRAKNPKLSSCLKSCQISEEPRTRRDNLLKNPKIFNVIKRKLLVETLDWMRSQ